MNTKKIIQEYIKANRDVFIVEKPPIFHIKNILNIMFPGSPIGQWIGEASLSDEVGLEKVSLEKVNSNDQKNISEKVKKPDLQSKTFDEKTPESKSNHRSQSDKND